MTESIVIGTAADCDIVVQDDYASSRHARVTRSEDGRVWVEDLASTNGTWVNGRRVWGPQQLVHGDRLRIGKREVYV
jgi:pSer/pThr/pTyr-binding forkhead associated (FHA) protein